MENKELAKEIIKEAEKTIWGWFLTIIVCLFGFGVILDIFGFLIRKIIF